MSLTDVQRSVILFYVQSKYPTIAQFRAYAGSRVGPERVGKVPQAAALSDDADAIVRELEAEVALLRKLIEPWKTDQSIVRVDEVLAGMAESTPEDEDPFEARLLSPREAVFLDRLELRVLLRDVERGARMTLAVWGPPRSGKTWTKDFVAFVARRSGDRVAIVTDAGALAPYDLADTIVGEMIGAQAPPEQGPTQADRWYRKLAQHVQRSAEATGKRWWIVLDGLSVGGADAPTIAFVNSMVRQVRDSSVALDHLRIVLLDYPPGIDATATDPLLLHRHEIASTALEREFVEDFFVRLYEERLQRSLAPDDLKLIVDRTFAQAGSGDIDRIGPAAQAIAAAILREG
ncbi:MAG: hypothetical protein IT378_06355 [Sandaracinaceae bacterium]|nr:hypothetical protein [Sandaracinaceae bacterium]